LLTIKSRFLAGFFYLNCCVFNKTYEKNIQNSSFQFLTKARNGKTLIGGTPSFMTGQIWINKRQETIVNLLCLIMKNDKSLLNKLVIYLVLSLTISCI